jgi:hypothetical protein
MHTARRPEGLRTKRETPSWVLNGNPDEQSDQIAELVIGMSADRDAYAALIREVAYRRGRDRRIAFGLLVAAYGLVVGAFGALAAIAVSASASTSQVVLAASASVALALLGAIFGYYIHREVVRRRELRKEVDVLMKEWRRLARSSSAVSAQRAKSGRSGRTR